MAGLAIEIRPLRRAPADVVDAKGLIGAGGLQDFVHLENGHRPAPDGGAIIETCSRG